MLKDRVKTDYLTPSTLYDSSRMYWFEISNKFYEFNRMEDQLKKYDSLKEDDLMNFVEVRKILSDLIIIFMYLSI